MLKKYEESNIQNIANKIREKTGSEKTYKVSEMPSGVGEVYEAGRNDILDNSKYIPKTAIGKVISLTDVSEVYHKVKVAGSGEVEVYGKNLCDYTKAFARATTSSLIIDETTNSIIYNGDYYFKIPMKLPSGQPVTVSGEGVAYFVFEYEDGSLGNANGVITKTTEKTTRNIYFYKYNATVSETGYVFRNIQVELGSNATPYEPYKGQTITATPTGTEVSSMCPNMNFFADSDVTVDYFGSFGRAEKELAMWNALTNYGTREVYSSAFAYTDYSGYTIPKGLCKPRQTIGSMFYVYQGVELPKGVDCSEFNVSTTTQSYHPYNTFAYSPKLKRIYDIGIPANVMIYGGTYRGCSALETIEIIRSAENTTFDANCFNGCSKLTHCIFSGVIASDINLQWSKLLDEESLVSLAVTLAHLIETGENPEGSNVPDGLQFTKTVTLSPESWAILENTLYPDTGLSCAEFITTVKGWLKA